MLVFSVLAHYFSEWLNYVMESCFSQAQSYRHPL